MFIDEISPELRKNLNQQDFFQYFWQLPKNWYEPPNSRRGGWSGVVTHKLLLEEQSTQVLFVKLQSSSVYKTAKHPFSGLPTFYREYLSAQKAKRAGVSVLEFLYYGQRGRDAVLVSKSLEGYSELNQVLVQTKDKPVLRTALLQRLTENLLNMHSAKISHGALHQKHVLVKIENDEIVDLRFIDFEQSKRKRSLRSIAKDLYQLFRKTDFTDQDKAFIFKQYAMILSHKKIAQLKQKIVVITQRKIRKKTKKNNVKII